MYQSHIHFGLIEHLHPVECMMIDQKQFFIQGAWSDIAILDEIATKRYVDDFFKIWNISKRGISVYDFIRQEIQKLKEEF